MKKARIYKNGDKWAVVEFPIPGAVIYCYCKSWQAAVDFLLRGDWMGLESVIWSGP